MLVQNRLSHSPETVKPKSPKLSAREKFDQRKQRQHNSLKLKTNQTIIAKQHKSRPLPLWLKILLLIKNTSSIVCWVSVGSALIMYSMTVYAPELWTQKYNQLRNLQKRERQFTLGDETVKNQLANTASRADSGLINPDPTKPPIFLAEITVKEIDSSPENNPPVKKIKQIYPVAY